MNQFTISKRVVPTASLCEALFHCVKQKLDEIDTPVLTIPIPQTQDSDEDEGSLKRQKTKSWGDANAELKELQ